MKHLVIAEKPSVARDIARVLHCNKKTNTYIEGTEYIVTWALGHLVTLAYLEEYGKEYQLGFGDPSDAPERLETGRHQTDRATVPCSQRTDLPKRRLRHHHRHRRRARGRTCGALDPRESRKQKASETSLDLLRHRQSDPGWIRTFKTGKRLLQFVPCRRGARRIRLGCRHQRDPCPHLQI